MIFDLQLFAASGVSPSTKDPYVIDIGSTGGIGIGKWEAGKEYAIGFEYENGIVSNLSIAEGSGTTSVSYIDLNNDGKAQEDEIVKLTGTSAGTIGGASAFSIGGTWITATTTKDTYSSLSWDGKVLNTDKQWVTANSTAMSSSYVIWTGGSVDLKTVYGYTLTNATAAGMASVSYFDLDNSGSLNAGDLVTAFSSSGTVAMWGTTVSAWTGLSMYNGSTSLITALSTSFSAVKSTAVTAYTSDYLFQDGKVLGSVANSSVSALTSLSASKDDGWQTTSITAGTIANPNWGTTVSTFMYALSDVSWDGAATTSRKISHIKLAKNMLHGDLAPYTLNINNGYMSSISLESMQANLQLTSVSNMNASTQRIFIDGIDTNSAIARTITFNNAKNIRAFLGMNGTGTAGLDIKNDTYTTNLLGGSHIDGDTYVQAKKTGKITFKTSADDNLLYFGEGTDSAFVDMSSEGASLTMRSEETTGQNNIYIDSLIGGGMVDIIGLKGKSNVVIEGYDGSINVKDSDGQASVADTLAGVSIIGGEGGNNTWSYNRNNDGAYGPRDTAGNIAFLSAKLTGKGLEYLDIGTHGAAITATSWVFSNRSVVGAKGDNVLSIGEHSILDVEGGIYTGSTLDLNGDGLADGANLLNNNLKGVVVGTHLFGSGDADKTGEKGQPSVLAITTAADTSGVDKAERIGKYEVMQIESQGKNYSAMVVSGDSLSSSDKGINWSNYDIIVGDKLDLTGITDKKNVYLNNQLGRTDQGETLSYSANMTSVISSSVGGSQIIGDFENSVYFYGRGHLDSLFGGYAYEHTSSRHVVNGDTVVDGVTVSVDTLGSAAGKKAWMGSSDYSGQTKVELLHNGKDTYNFGFVGEDYSLAGAKGTETDDTADVLTLMHGMGVASLQGSEHGRANLIVGANAEHNFTFQSISEGVHDVLYTFELGRDPQKARVDTSLLGTESGYNYQDDVNFYLGFDNGTVLTMNSGDSDKMLNYGGNSVIQGIASIDGSAAAGGNVLNGQNDHAEYIIASAKAGDTLCGGLNNSYTDKGNDTLVGGAGADTFWVGDDMGNDVINNLTDGDTIVFLGSKFADATLNYENERMVDYADSHWMTVAFEGEDSTTKISITPGDGVTKHMSDLKNVTAVFDDGTYTWNGQQWTQA